MDIDISDLEGKVLLSDDEVIDYITSNYWVQQVFSIEDLSEWAENNGFVKEEPEE